jgi:hypothetical protein
MLDGSRFMSVRPAVISCPRLPEESRWLATSICAPVCSLGDCKCVAAAHAVTSRLDNQLGINADEIKILIHTILAVSMGFAPAPAPAVPLPRPWRVNRRKRAFTRNALMHIPEEASAGVPDAQRIDHIGRDGEQDAIDVGPAAIGAAASRRARSCFRAQAGNAGERRQATGSRRSVPEISAIRFRPRAALAAIQGLDRHPASPRV